ncbi:hypothetical protein GJV78_05160 [Escherichia alba]|uniref:Tle cognate immunity protein 4 C-terminal domain-containing protein n=1 Tax=Intestinirhabdus alba TaxID=2899544 RepID=A0A6L6IFV3_9ENTR|nr:hypothetical protein [Intestinirhabdus alba]
MTENLFFRTRPQCIGRYLIDVPESFNNQRRDMVFIDEFKIESKPQYRPAFEQRVQRREKELVDSINNPGNKPETAPYVKEIIHLQNGRGIIFDHNIPGTPDNYRQLEAHIYSNEISFVIKTDIRDFTDERHKKKKAQYIAGGFTEENVNNKSAKLAALKSLISRLSGRQDEDIPTGKGLCIPNGFIRDDGYKHKEQVTFSYKNDDFIFWLYMSNEINDPDDTLFNRSAQINEVLKQSQTMYSIRKKAFSPGGIPVQEWLFGDVKESYAPAPGEKDKVAVYHFKLEANEAVSSAEKPVLSIGLSSERTRTTTYSQTQMIEIWDRLVGTLRYRPGTF